MICDTLIFLLICIFEGVGFNSLRINHLEAVGRPITGRLAVRFPLSLLKDL